MTLYPLLTILSSAASVTAFSPNCVNINRHRHRHRHRHVTSLNHAKRRKNENPEDNAWYDAVNEDATPDDVFWEEMERQKAISGIPPPSTSAQDDPFRAIGIGSTPLPPPRNTMDSPSAPGPGTGNGNGNGSGNGSKPFGGATNGQYNMGVGMPMSEERATEKTLASYATFMVDNNWLDEQYADTDMMGIGDDDLAQQDADLDRQLEAWEKEGDNNSEGRRNLASMTWGGTEPWDSWRDYSQDVLDGDEEEEDDGKIKIDMERGK